MPLRADEDHVGLAAEHLHNKLLFHRRAHFVARVEVQNQQPLKVRLHERFDPRADKVLAQQHTEHRRLLRVFKAPLRQMHARAADAAVDEKLFVAVACAQTQQQQVALRLLHLVNLRAGDARFQFAGQPREKYSVQRHSKHLRQHGKQLAQPLRLPL